MPNKKNNKDYKIYDCFQFFNELDLLELRLEELHKHVDYFILVEARQAHDGSPKELIYKKNKKRFAKYSKQIIHVPIDLPKLNWFDNLLVKLSQKGNWYKLTSKIVAFGHGRMKMDWAQRRGIAKGLKKARDRDLIMVSDLDEIPDTRKMKKAINLARKDEYVCFSMKHFIYYLNGRVRDGGWAGTRIFTKRLLKKRFGNDIQRTRIDNWDYIKQRYFGIAPNMHILENAGWHFTYMGGWEKVVHKRKVFAHSEVSSGDAVDEEKVRKQMESGDYVYKDGHAFKIDYIPVDKTFPQTLQKNAKKYKHLLKTPKRKTKKA